MSGWVLTLGLQNLRAQIDEWAPDRDHTSDGTIGDAAHQREISDHNPDDSAGAVPGWNGDPDSLPEVRAFDCDIDFRNGATAQQVVDHIRRLPGINTVIRYMIYNRLMYHERDGFAPTPYTGASAHTEHIHFSGAYTQASDNDLSFDYRLRDLTVALTNDDVNKVAAATAALLTKRDPLNGADGKPDGTFTTPIGNAAWGQGIPAGNGQARTAAWKVLASVGDSVNHLGSGSEAPTADAIAEALISAGLAGDVVSALISKLYPTT